MGKNYLSLPLNTVVISNYANAFKKYNEIKLVLKSKH